MRFHQTVMLVQRLFVASCLFLAHAVAATPVRAQSSADSAMAESLFQQARNLMSSGDTEGACAKFAESQRLEVAVGTSLNLATCYESLGKTASAWAEFSRALAMAEREGDTERASLAEARIAALSQRLSKLIVHPPPSSESPSLVIDGRELSSAAWGSALPFDPGFHDVQIAARNRLPWTTRIELPVGPVEIVVEVPPLEPVGSPSPERKLPIGDERNRVELPSPAPSDGPSDGAPVELWISLGVTAAAATVGTVAAVDFHRQKAIIEARCDGRYCDDEGLAADERARSSATVADISFGAAALAGIFTGYLWYTLPDAGGTRVALSPFDRSRSFTLGVAGRY